MITVYLSGKITGMPIEEARTIFTAAELALRLKGYEVINPLSLDHGHNGDWINYMVVDLEALMRHADAIYMLDGWGESRGARIEYAIAREMGLKVMFQTCNAVISQAEVSRG